MSLMRHAVAAVTMTAAMALLVMTMDACKMSQRWTDAPVPAFEATAQEPGVALIDVRTPQEFMEGHLHGAVNVDLNDPDGFIDKARAILHKGQRVAVYCRSGRRSAEAAKQLTAAGFKVCNLEGGILAWEAAGKPVDLQ